MKAGKLKKIEVSESKVNKDDNLDEQKAEDEESIENNEDNE